VSTVELLVARCAGLDVAKDEVVACVRVPDGHGGRDQEVRTFQTFTSGLEALADWLDGEGVNQVVMEATGQYWKPIWYVLEERGFALLLAGARHVKILPGRKTDVCDAAWLCELLEHGLLRGSFVPPAAIRELRDPGPLSQAADPGPQLGGPAHPKDPGGRRHQARLGRR
jgi:transposase